MPFRDGTGPTGAGPRTGRSAGNCAGQGGLGRFGGRGIGGGHAGRGPGRGLGFDPQQERSWLEQQLKSLRSALQSITDRLDALQDK
jgi:hypothetical protein